MFKCSQPRPLYALSVSDLEINSLSVRLLADKLSQRRVRLRELKSKQINRANLRYIRTHQTFKANDNLSVSFFPRVDGRIVVKNFENANQWCSGKILFGGMLKI
jgi:hypothetical protein